MGEEHWQVISRGGRVISVTPQGLWEDAVSYFKWCGEQPIRAQKTLQSGKEAGKKVDIELKRPFTIEGFCLHAGITKRWLMDIKSMHGEQSEWYMIAEKIITVIYTQNLEGALVDLFNPIVISKILNLDKPKEDESRPVRVEIIDTGKNNLPTNEKDILDNLDFDMVEKFKDKLAEEHDKEHSA